MTHRAAGVNDVRYISSRSVGSGEPAARANVQEPWKGPFVQQNGPDRIMPDRTDTMESATASSHPARWVNRNCRSGRIPGILGLKDGLTTFPRVKVIGIDQIKILIVLPAIIA